MAESWACGASRDLALSDADSWDAGKAEASVWSWAGFDGDSPDSGKAKRCFLAYDKGAPDKKSSYKLPFAQVEDGTPKAVKRGVDAAAARLNQTQIPDAVKETAQGVISHYQDRFGEGKDEKANGALFAVGTPVVRVGNAGADLLALAKERAPDPDALDEHAPFFFRVVPSTTRLDSFFTRMLPSSLQNFATDFAEGRAFLDSHVHWQQPLGKSLTGRFVGGANARAEADFMLPHGLSNGVMSSDDMINLIRTGVTSDVSIGFYGGKWICSICGRDMLTDWDCWHIPGFEYDANAKNPWGDYATQTTRAKKKGGDDGAQGAPAPEMQMCTADIDGAHAAECSGVYDGATPGAVVLKAQREADAGRLRPDAARIIEARYRVRVLGADPTWRGWAPSDPRANDTAAPMRTPKEGSTMTLEDQIRQLLAVPEGDDVLAAVRDLNAKHADHLERTNRERDQARAAWKRLGVPDGGDAVAWLDAEFARLRPLADDGTRYRADLIDDAVAEGVRAKGADFATETYRAVLTTAPIETIKRFREDWKAEADKVFPGGRRTDDGKDPLTLVGGDGKTRERRPPARLLGGA